MKRSVTIVLAILSLAAGTLTGEFLSRTPAAHRLLGRLFGRGELVALVGHRGVFDIDSIPGEVLRVSAAHTTIGKGELEPAMFALRGQFGDERTFVAALHRNGIWRWQLRRRVRDELRGAKWINEQIAGETSVSRDEARRYFEEHQAEFTRPLRLHPRHIFLAAPQGSENLETKRVAMQEIVARLKRGEDFASLAAAVSEDDATKSRGGDLEFLASNRVPAEFWSAMQKLPVNGLVAVVQSHLGFHAVQILEMRPPQAMTFEEARPEIETILAGERRRLAVERLREELARQAMVVSR